MPEAAHPRPRIGPIGPHHDRSAFSSGVEPLDHYLRHQAGQDMRRHAAAVFVLTEGESHAVLGYYTLAATGAELENLPDSIAKRLPRYPMVPAVLLGRLAVDQSRRGRRYGQLLLMDALRRCLEITEIGWAVVVVDAKDESSASFYEHFEFMRFSSGSRRLFLPRRTISSLFE